ncbi:polyketide synthase docking domain-containing protein, partial [Streptomyces olivaceus]|uniref:polyketide synthase docking domain-containing protein n=1 Tax=Streptomyces olivaceus TaxID=47716 RepID=UPI003663EA21
MENEDKLRQYLKLVTSDLYQARKKITEREAQDTEPRGGGGEGGGGAPGAGGGGGRRGEG